MTTSPNKKKKQVGNEKSELGVEALEQTTSQQAIKRLKGKKIPINAGSPKPEEYKKSKS